jgi:hypothetical protein
MTTVRICAEFGVTQGKGVLIFSQIKAENVWRH